MAFYIPYLRYIYSFVYDFWILLLILFIIQSLSDIVKQIIHILQTN